MSTDIFDYPPVERKYVAVRRFITTIGGEKMFNKLLGKLGLSREEFTMEYGERLIGNPAMFNQMMVDIIREDARRIRRNSQ